MELIVMILIVMLFSACITYGLYRLKRENRYIRYISSLFFGILAIIFYIKMKVPSEGFKDLGSFVYALLSCFALVSSLAVNVWLELKKEKKKKKD